jgi:hypothetical protein
MDMRVDFRRGAGRPDLLAAPTVDAAVEPSDEEPAGGGAQ